VPLLLDLARDAGLVRVEEERFEVVAAALDPWRGQGFPEQTRTLFARWRAAPDWPEGPSQDDLQLANVDWSLARAAILEELRACAVGEWYDAATLALRIARLRAGLLGGSFHAARASGPAGTREEVTTAAVEAALLGALVPFGLLADGTHREGKRTVPAVAVTEVGAWLLGARPEPRLSPIGDRPLTVGADFEILLFQPIPRRVWALGAIADLVRLDTASTYRLSEASVRRGIAAGLTLDQIVTLLERGGRAPLPQNVAFTLREWTRDHAGVRLARALISDPTTRHGGAPARRACARWPASAGTPGGWSLPAHPARRWRGRAGPRRAARGRLHPALAPLSARFSALPQRFLALFSASSSRVILDSATPPRTSHARGRGGSRGAAFRGRLWGDEMLRVNIVDGEKNNPTAATAKRTKKG
jgi:hypothetical protein